MPVDPREHMAAAVGGKVGGDDIVKAEPVGNGLDIEAVGCGGHDVAVSRRLLLGHTLAQLRIDIFAHHQIGMAFEIAGEFLGRDAVADQQHLRELLQPRAIPDLQRIERQTDGQQRRKEQSPRRLVQSHMQQEAIIGRAAGHRFVHVVNGKQGFGVGRHDVPSGTIHA